MKKAFLCVLLILLCGCSTSTSNSKQPEDHNATYCDDSKGCGFGEKADMSGYENFDTKNSMFEESDMAHLLTAIKEKKSGIFYLGYPKCPWCIEAIPVLNDIAKKHNQSIAYVRTRDDDSELIYTPDQKKELISYASTYMNLDDEGEYQIYVPFVLVIKDGKVVAGHVGTVDGHDAHERKMNEQEKKDLQSIYEDMFQKLK